MNYQAFSPFFTRFTSLLLFFVALGLSFYGISALLIYFLLIGIVFPVIISMRLHRLNETGTALSLTENTQWITYIHGFPAQEQRSVLRNPCFFSAERLRQFFIYGFTGKLCLQLACMAILVNDALHGTDKGIPALLVLLFILWRAGNSLWHLSRLIANKWQCETLTTDSGSIWFQGLTQGEERQTLFTKLC